MLQAPPEITADGDALQDPRVFEAKTAGEKARLERLVDQYYDFVGRSLRSLGVPEGEVDDAAQQVFLVAARRLGEIEVDRERSFLFQTVVRIASRARRTVQRRRESPHDESFEMSDPRPTPDELVDHRRARVVLVRVLSTMDLDLRTVFVLCELEELTMAEAAATLGLANGTVASRLRRARDVFRERIRAWQGETP